MGSYVSFCFCEVLLAVLILFGRLQKSLWKQLTENRPHNFRRYEQLFQDKLYSSAFFEKLLCRSVFQFRSPRPKNSGVGLNFPKYDGLAKIPQMLWQHTLILSVRVQSFSFWDYSHNQTAQGRAIRPA